MCFDRNINGYRDDIGHCTNQRNLPFRFDRELHSCDPRNSSVYRRILTAILHRGLRNCFFSFLRYIYFLQFLFGLLFPFFYLDFVISFLFGLLFPFFLFGIFFFNSSFNSSFNYFYTNRGHILDSFHFFLK